MVRRSVCLLLGTMTACAATVFFASNMTNGIVLAGVESDGSVKINETNFPDANFREKVKTYDKDGNGVLSTSERKVTWMQWKKCDIASIAGIEYFTDLESLDVDDNKITSVNLSANTKLRYLNVASNQLTAIDVSKNESLSVLYVSYNPIQKLDLSKNKSLTEVSCDRGGGEATLTSLNVSGLQYLCELECRGQKLTKLDVSSCPNLELLYCASNNLSELDLSKNTKLERLDCSDNQLSSLNVSSSTALYELSCSGNKIGSLDVSKNTALQTLYCTDTDITTLNVSANKALTELSCGNGSSNKNGKKLASLNMKGLTALRKLYCGYTALTSLDISANTGMTFLNMPGNQFTTSLDLSKMTELYQLDVDYSKFPTLNLSNKTKLREVSLGGAEISTVNLSGCTSLSRIGVFEGSTKIATLNISGVTSLNSLSCRECGIASLNVSGATALKTLKCETNNLTTLDVSSCSSLETLICKENNLSTLKLGSISNLVELKCSDNELTSLDVSKAAKLMRLECYRNPISKLNLNSNPLLNACMSHRVSSYISNCFMYKLSDTQYVYVDKNTNVIASNLTPTPTNTNTPTPTNSPTPSPTPKIIAAINETNFPDEVFRNYVLRYYDKNGDKILSEPEVSDVTELNIYSDPNMKSIKGVEYFTEVRELNCSSSDIRELDISKLTKLEKLTCVNNQIKKLDCSKNTKLKRLSISSNGMTSLNISGLSSLQVLICQNNALSSINLNGCTRLLDLVKRVQRRATGMDNYSYSSPVCPTYTYDVPGNTSEQLIYDRITDIISSSLTPTPTPPPPAAGSVAVNSTNFPDAAFRQYIKEVDMDENRNGALEKSEINKVIELAVFNRDIKSLTGMEYFEKVRWINCEHNQLTSLNLTKCPDLESLDCYDNQIKELNLYFCPNIAKTVTEGYKSDEEDAWLYFYYLGDDQGYFFAVDKTTNVTVTKPTAGKPSGVKAESASSTSVDISWNAVSGAKGYQVWRSTSATGTFTSLGTVTTTSRVSTGLTTGKTYYYKVRAYVEVNGTKYYGSYSSVVSAIPLAEPAGVKATSASDTSIKVSWDAVSEATGYQVWRGTSETGTFTSLGTVTTTSRTCTGLTTGKTYYFKVRAYKEVNGTKYYGAYSTVVSAVPKVAKPSGVKATAASTSSIEVSWNAVTGATGYQVCRSTSATGNFTSLGTVTTTSRVSTGLSSGTTYYYKVRAYKEVNGTKYFGSYSAVISGVTKPSAPGNVKATVSSSTSVTVSWNAVTGATGYEVRRAESSSGTYSKLGTVTTTSRACSGLTTGKAYYFKVRAYIEVNGEKIYGAYSTVVSATPKA